MVGTRVCLGCKETKPVTDFRWRNQSKNLRAPRCTPCDAAHRKRYYDSGGKVFTLEQNRRAAEKRAALILTGELQEKPTKKCNKCGEVKDRSQFRALSTKYGHVNPRCRECEPEHRLAHYQTNQSQFIANTKRRYRKLKQLINDIKTSSPCFDCGQSYPPYVMDFDHVDPTNKLCNVSRMPSKFPCEEKILAEIEKCDLVCSNCHRVREHNRQQEFKK